MKTTRGRAKWLARTIWCGVAVVLALAVPALAVAAPTAPGIKDATVYQGGTGVTVWWTASTDTQAGPIQYQVYRDDVPMTISNYVANGELVLTTADTTVTVTPKADELTKKFTYYYMVVATNTTTGSKAVSANITPNVHGGRRIGYSTYNCQLCHSVHGAPPQGYLGAATRYQCYRCHGNTDATKSYGDKAVRNVQRDFYDYTSGQTIPTTVSRHYNAFMQSNQTECTGCHTPHKSPYYVDPATGTKIDASSYTQLLRAEITAGNYYYSTDAAPSGNAFCLQCHGASSGAIEFNGGAGAYAASSGDHTYAAGAVHNETVVYTNNDSHATNPGIQCEACHNKHASAADKLIAYRGDDSSATSADGTYAQAEVCYACHSAGTTENRVAAGYVAPYAWNGRDVKAQFQKASRHPTTARVGGPPLLTGSWSQTTQAEFLTDVHTDTIVLPAGSVEIQPITTTSTLLNEGFESGNFTANSWTDPAQWAVTTNNTHAGTYKAELTSGGTRYDVYFQKSFDTSALTNPSVSYWWAFNGSGTTDYFGVQVSTDGTNFVALQPATLTDQTTYAAATYSLPVGATVFVRFNGSVNATGEYVRVDDVTVSGQVNTGQYRAGGSVLSTTIAVPGSLVGWSTLNYAENQPVGTNLTVDVLNGSDNTVLLTNVANGASLSSLTASSLRLRANLTGDLPAARTANDSFTDNSFDTAKWADVFLGSTDPDAPYSATLRSITFATALIDATTGMDSRSPNSDTTGWYRNTNNGQDGAAGYGRTGATDYDLERTMLKNFGDLSALSSVDASFYWQNNGSTMSAGDYLYVEWSTNGGTSWTTVGSVTTTAQDNTWGQLSATGLAVGTNCQLRVRALVQDAANDEWFVDSILVTGNYPAGTAWPREAGGALTLRAEGTDFIGTADEGEFTYIRPTAADWVDTQDFDMVVQVPSYNNLGADGWMKAGLMIRTGTTEANAYAANAAMVGLYVTDTNGVTFQYRSTAGGTASANTAGTGDAPMYLKLTRRGDLITGYKSTDGTTWTSVGSQTVTMSTFVLPGICLTSNVNGTFSEATFDDFSVVEASLLATNTPALLDWSVGYAYYAPVSTGYLTCTNCHNVHSVQRGTLGSVWQLVRASLPSNTKTTYAGTATQFCLECHDGTAPTTAANSATVLVPYTVEFSDKSAFPFFPGWNKTATGSDWTGGAHASTTFGLLQGQIGCQTCHDPHASDNARLTAYTYQEDGLSNAMHTGTVARNNSSTYAEQNLCYACHDQQSGGNCSGCHGTNLLTLNASTPFAATYRHPVEATGRHTDTETGAQLGASNRHSECADCHDPHAAAAGIHATGDSSPGNALRGATGVKVTAWPANWTAVAANAWIPERMTGEDADYEAYVCFKCHSSYSGQPFSVTSGSGTYTSTDVAMEFNPSNASEHNVLGQRTVMETAFTVGGSNYTWTKPADSAFLKTGYTANSQITCTDCHSNTATTAARGPHGSSVRWLIDPAYPTNWRTTYLTSSNMSNTTNICAKCHQNLGTANNTHSFAQHQRSTDGQCNYCHVGIPHGWKRPRLVGYTTDGVYASQRVTFLRLKNYTPTSWVREDCGQTGCSEHSGTTTDPVWP